MSFGDNLRVLMEERDLTQKELAMHLNIAPSTMSSYVLNTREPDFDTLIRIAEYFDVTTDYLLNIHSSKSNGTFEDELLRVFRSMTGEQQKIYIEQGKAFVKANHARKKKD